MTVGDEGAIRAGSVFLAAAGAWITYSDERNNGASAERAATVAATATYERCPNGTAGSSSVDSSPVAANNSNRDDWPDRSECDNNVWTDCSGDHGWDGLIFAAGSGDLAGGGAWALTQEECTRTCKLTISAIEVAAFAGFGCGYNRTGRHASHGFPHPDDERLVA
jgi:hypothetical protein